MGRTAIILVLAAVVGSATLMLGMQRNQRAADVRHVESQADLLAREIAEAGHQAAAGALVGPAGLTDPTARLGAEQDYAGGQFRIAYTPGSTADQATVRVTGIYGGAVHTSERAYERTKFDAPGPLWLDVPAAMAELSSRAVVSGGPVAFDPRQHEVGGLEPALPLASIRSDLATEANRVGTSLASPAPAEWRAPSGPLDGVNAADAADLYRRAVAAKTAGDRTLAGSQTIAGATTWGLASDGTQIFHVQGDLTVDGRLTGHGALVVDGDLRVPGELDWDGLVIARGTDPVIVVSLTGTVDVDGMVTVAHDIFPTSGTVSSTASSAVISLLEAGRPFGARVELGPNTRLNLDLVELKELAVKLGFDPDGVRMISSTSTHLTAAEARAGRTSPTGPASAPPTTTDPTATDPTATDPTATDPPPTDPTPTLPPDGDPIPPTLDPSLGPKVWICHFTPSTGAFRSNYVSIDALGTHSTHPGDYMGKCADATAETGGETGAGGGGGGGRGGGGGGGRGGGG